MTQSWNSCHSRTLYCYWVVHKFNCTYVCPSLYCPVSFTFVTLQKYFAHTLFTGGLNPFPLVTQIFLLRLIPTSGYARSQCPVVPCPIPIRIINIEEEINGTYQNIITSRIKAEESILETLRFYIALWTPRWGFCPGKMKQHLEEVNTTRIQSKLHRLL